MVQEGGMTTTEARVIIDRDESRAWDGLPMAVSKSVYDEAAKIVAADDEAIEAARVAAEVAQLGDLAVVTAGLLDGIDWDEGILDAGKLHFADRRKAAFVDGLTRIECPRGAIILATGNIPTCLRGAQLGTWGGKNCSREKC
jgi:hypothetical protein